MLVYCFIGVSRNDWEWTSKKIFLEVLRKCENTSQGFQLRGRWVSRSSQNLKSVWLSKFSKLSGKLIEGSWKNLIKTWFLSVSRSFFDRKSNKSTFCPPISQKVYDLRTFCLICSRKLYKSTFWQNFYILGQILALRTFENNREHWYFHVSQNGTFSKKLIERS